MKVHVEIERAAEALYQGHGARRRAGTGQPCLADQVPGNRPVDDPEYLRDELGPCRQQVAQREGQRQHPLANGLFREHVVDQECRRLRHPPGAAAGAEPAALTGECHEFLGLAGVALDAQKAVLEQAAPEIGVELVLNVTGQGSTLGCAPVPQPRIVLGHQLVKERRLGPVPRIPRRGDEILRLRNVAARRAHAVLPCTASTG